MSSMGYKGIINNRKEFEMIEVDDLKPLELSTKQLFARFWTVVILDWLESCPTEYGISSMSSGAVHVKFLIPSTESKPDWSTIDEE